MDTDLLTSIAGFCVAIAGFSTLLFSLGQTRSRSAPWNIRAQALLIVSYGAFLLAILPLVISSYGTLPYTSIRISSLVSGVYAVICILLATMEEHTFKAIGSKYATIGVALIAVVSALLQLLNAFAILSENIAFAVFVTGLYWALICSVIMLIYASQLVTRTSTGRTTVTG